MKSAKEYWKERFDEYPQNDAERLAVVMMMEYYHDITKDEVVKNNLVKPNVSGEFAAFKKFVKDLIGSTEYDVIEKEWEKQAANFR